MTKRGKNLALEIGVLEAKVRLVGAMGLDALFANLYCCDRGAWSQPFKGVKI